MSNKQTKQKVESIRLLVDAKGAIDGINIRQYLKGEVYEIGSIYMSDSLASVLVEAKQGEYLEQEIFVEGE